MDKTINFLDERWCSRLREIMICSFIVSMLNKISTVTLCCFQGLLWFYALL